MNSLQSAQHVINLLVMKSKEKLHEKKIIASKLIRYSSNLAQNNRNDAIMHAGTQFDQSSASFFKRQLKSEQRPISNVKDTYSFFSVKKTKQDRKQNSQISIPKQKSPQKTIKKLFQTASHSHSKSKRQKESINLTQASVKLSIPKQPLLESFFVKLEDPNQKIPKYLEKQDYHINDLRERKNYEEQQKETSRKRQQTESQVSTQRQNKLNSYLQNHLSKPNNSYTFDIEGKMLLFSFDDNKKAISKAFPNTIKYQLDPSKDQEGLMPQKPNQKTQKNRAYSNLEFKKKERINPSIDRSRGQIFKSSVLNSINLSRISLGNDHIDQTQFMKRNDLFNNNHSRQTTSIPFLKMQGRTSFKQTATNQSISNKGSDTQTLDAGGKQKRSKSISQLRPSSHDCRAIKEFKKFSLKRQSEPDCNSSIEHFPEKKIYAGTCQIFKKINSIGDSRYSSFYVQKSHKSQAGRIKRQNDLLFHSMLDVNEEN